jgi:hypothetical protein
MDPLQANAWPFLSTKQILLLQDLPVTPNLIDSISMFDGQGISPFWFKCSPAFAVEQKPPFFAHAVKPGRK